MNYFICTIEKFKVGIPASFTERIIPSNRDQKTIIEITDSEIGGQMRFISIPLILNIQNVPVPHGIIIKSAVLGFKKPCKTVFLLPPIETSIDIPDHDIKLLPESFGTFYGYFSGVCFSGKDMILLLNPKAIAEKLT